MIIRIGVLGLSKLGNLAATLLSSKYEVEGMDLAEETEKYPFQIVTGDVSKEKTIRNFLKDKEAVVSFLPYFLNIKRAETAVDIGVHYFDLTKDVPTLNAILEMSTNSKSELALNVV